MANSKRRGAAAALALLALTGGSATDSAAADRGQPLVIGHRGASGYRPEHTLASYELAARMGADYVEPDLVITRDGVLVARHENEISQTTDVAKRAEFRSRKTVKRIDGKAVKGWFTEDFTFAELRTLRARERIPGIRPRNTAYDGRYGVPSFQEVVDLTRRLSRELGREIGLYPETKHPTYFRAYGLPLEEPLVAALRRNGLDRAEAKVFVQSFEVDNLKRLNRMTNVRLVQLLDDPGERPWDVRVAKARRTYRDLATAKGLRAIARYADGVGPNKDYVIPPGRRPTSFVADAHAAGLLVHPYAFRSENRYLPPKLRSNKDPNARGRAAAEYRLFYAARVDGVFSDFPDVAVLAR
ncbi:MAG: glycerophosphodiester phosphodiesterase [Sporichthyaceae bacterium]